MKVLLVNGSPHKNGSTNRALEEMKKTFEQEGLEAEIFWIGNKPVSGCIACGGCAKTGRCVIDDCVNEFKDKASEADGFVFGAPVHYASNAGNMASFMDRIFYSNRERERYRLKPAACVAVCRRAGAEPALERMSKYFSLAEMPLINGFYWNDIFGHNAAEVEQDLEGLQNLRTVARNMVYYLKLQEAGRAAGIEMPQREEPRVYTSFFRKG
ncbi:MAG: flavodoxin family protein [Lachnospiraceae bacterium]|nr:flavodoxin family protein [Lachnospiraceae bacterium]